MAQKQKQQAQEADLVELKRLTPQGGSIKLPKAHAERLMKLEEKMEVKNYEYLQNGDTE